MQILQNRRVNVVILGDIIYASKYSTNEKHVREIFHFCDLLEAVIILEVLLKVQQDLSNNNCVEDPDEPKGKVQHEKDSEDVPEVGTFALSVDLDPADVVLALEAILVEKERNCGINHRNYEPNQIKLAHELRDIAYFVYHASINRHCNNASSSKRRQIKSLLCEGVSHTKAVIFLQILIE